MRIVIIEDNETLARAVKGALQDQGFGVDWLADGLAGESFLRQSRPDVAVIDINLPGQSGLEIVRALRRRHDATPILILTARGATSQRVEGLDAGADDYLVKPFEMEELIARLRALGRRRPSMDAPTETLGNLTFHRGQRQLMTVAGAIELPRRELALFECLLEHRARIVSKTMISDTLYGTGAEVEANAIELLVSRLRRKLEGTGVHIHTARGLGYMLDGEDN
ncbi:response regulator transcription factor [Rhizobium halophytocola]|uniref:Two-component system OmpR family response regulator n=1 Tax=Rhizobium halophytocola TaxID=735519 RepID=A0ABS4DU90_9HYPH|nr:response regulator transcription factor [Rhizobium halophytocola]MBP1849263.1 two-component system OmpR family response regulator [Rhizobium halophytocola]